MRLLKPDGDTNTMKSRSKYHGKRPPNHLVCALANLFGVFLGKETVLSLWKLGISFVGYKREYCTPKTFIENRLFACKKFINRFAHCNHWKWFRVFIKGETWKIIVFLFQYLIPRIGYSATHLFWDWYMVSTMGPHKRSACEALLHTCTRASSSLMVSDQVIKFILHRRQRQIRRS